MDIKKYIQCQLADAEHEEERLVAMYTDKTYTLSGLSREFIKEIQILANARGMHRDYNIVTEVALPIHAEDRANENAFRDSFKAGDLIFAEGEQGDSLHIIRSGGVALSRMVDGEEVLVGDVTFLHDPQ